MSHDIDFHVMNLFQIEMIKWKLKLTENVTYFKIRAVHFHTLSFSCVFFQHKHLFLSPTKVFFLLIFSCCKSLIAHSLSYTPGTVSRHLLPRSLSVCPVAGSALHTYNTGHGPNNAAHLGPQLATSHKHSLPLLPWCTLQLTVNVHFHT